MGSVQLAKPLELATLELEFTIELLELDLIDEELTPIELLDFTLEELTPTELLDFTLDEVATELELTTELLDATELDDLTLEELATELLVATELEDFTLDDEELGTELDEDEVGQLPPPTTPNGAGCAAQVEGAIQLLPFS